MYFTIIIYYYYYQNKRKAHLALLLESKTRYHKVIGDWSVYRLQTTDYDTVGLTRHGRSASRAVSSFRSVVTNNNVAGGSSYFTQTSGSYDDNLRYGHYGVIESAILIIKIWYAFPGLVH